MMSVAYRTLQPFWSFSVSCHSNLYFTSNLAWKTYYQKQLSYCALEVACFLITSFCALQTASIFQSPFVWPVVDLQLKGAWIFTALSSL